ncbi:ANTAR domain-containing protein [Prauserella shujinwangii]|uniref:ANTAR domain-containing protein n=1 Tax=Prauserella shujinwangii TaxID=1453103 RepID=A0A2T0LU44_9PSEU|nr:ANTAR domain-containing protein [Prauserella shujinwangii]PRX47214.1 ANTAR domain-containing protein [Prauserella shujinwangii]
MSAQVDSLQEELNGLRRALRTRATIEQAMGVLVVSHRCSPQQAFRILVRLSQQHNIKLHRIAQVLVRLAARVEPAQIEPLLRRAAASNSVPFVGPDAHEDTGPDEGVIELARKLVDAEGEEAAKEALTALFELLVDRGWVPPYEVLAGLRVRS